MVNRRWLGGTGDWNTATGWDPYNGLPPQPADTVVITSGTVVLTTNAGGNGRFENNRLTLGGSAAPTLLLRDQQPTGRFFNVTFAGAGTIEADGVRGFSGSITGNPNNGSTITLRADAGGELVLLAGGSLNLVDGAINLEGAITVERDALLSGNIINNGTLSILSGETKFVTNSVSGVGTIRIGAYGNLSLQGTAVPTTQTIRFDGAGGILALSYQNAGEVVGTIQNFAPYDYIDFVGFGTATSETLDTVNHTLTINDSTGRTYVYTNFYGEAGTLSSVRQSNGHDLIGYASAPNRLDTQIDAGARAMHADIVHTMTIPGTTTPITGAGVKVGIISNSFNIGGGASADIANGYLPASGVTVLREGTAGDTDEGRAMAQLIHQVAPGASLYFASTGSGVDDFATSVQALQAAGCTVIVDDIGLIGSEPFFQLGSPAENAISAAIAGGVTYLSSVGNYGDSYYQHNFTTTPDPVALYDGSSVKAMIFGDSGIYQSFTATGGLFDQIDLQWDAPFYGVGGTATDQPCSVSFKVFDSARTLVGTSTQVSLGGHLVSESELVLPFSSTSKDYVIAIYQSSDVQPINQIKYVISGALTGAGVGGRINDPDAGVGSGVIDGHQLVPGNITVAATDITNTPAFGRQPSFAESFSSIGTGTLLFDELGNRLATPIEVGSPDVTGPDAINTSVTGFSPFSGTSAAAPSVAGVAALLQQLNPSLAPSAISSILAQSATPLTGATAAVAGAGLVQADHAIQLAEQIACYCAGTLILTDLGEIPVEHLQIGDAVVTASGELRPIRWIGQRSYSAELLEANPDLLPIRIRAGALADQVPRRDLLLSPLHALYVDDLLIPVRALFDGRSILREPACATLDYFHVELDTHDIILAEGAAAESFLDDGGREMFDNTDGFHALYPGARRDLKPFRRRVEQGRGVQRVREHLAIRASCEAVAG